MGQDGLLRPWVNFQNGMFGLAKVMGGQLCLEGQVPPPRGGSSTKIEGSFGIYGLLWETKFLKPASLKKVTPRNH